MTSGARPVTSGVKTTRTTTLTMTVVVLAGGQATAQETKVWVPEALPAATPAAAAEAAATPAEPDGWKLKLHFGGNTSFGHNSQVVGSVDGSTFQVGIVMEGKADLKAGQHEWLNELQLHHQQTKTPALDVWQKSMDDLKLMSTYLYHLEAVPWVGPFARLKLDTVVFATETTKAEDYDVINTADPKEVPRYTRHSANAATRLAGPFEPLTLRQSAGFFADPVKSEPANLGFKLGAGVQELIVRDGFALTKSDEPGRIEITPLKDSVEAGAEFEAVFTGAVDKRISYELAANFLYPFLLTDDKGIEGIELLNADIHGKLSIKLTDWGSLDLVAGAKRQPLVANQWQLSTGVLLNAGFDLL
jgi:hypothetical protein